MTVEPPEPQGETKPKSRGERRLAMAGVAVFAGLLVVSIALWVRHGEEIFISRIVTAIANCF